MSADLPVYHGLSIACWRDKIEVLRAQEAEMSQTLYDYNQARDKYTDRLKNYTRALLASKTGLKQLRRQMRARRHPKNVSKGFRHELADYKRNIRQFSALAEITNDSLALTTELYRTTCEKLQQVRTDFAFALSVEDQYVSDVLGSPLDDNFSEVDDSDDAQISQEIDRLNKELLDEMDAELQAADEVTQEMYDEETTADEKLDEATAEMFDSYADRMDDNSQEDSSQEDNSSNSFDDLVFATDLSDEQYVNDLSDNLGSFEDFPDIAAYPGLLADEADE